MPRLQERTIKKGGKLSSSFLVTIPKDIINRLGWEKGDFLSITPTTEKKVLIENIDRKDS